VRSVRATYKYRRERGRWLSRWSSKEERRKRKEIEKNLDLLAARRENRKNPAKYRIRWYWSFGFELSID